MGVLSSRVCQIDVAPLALSPALRRWAAWSETVAAGTVYPIQRPSELFLLTTVSGRAGAEVGGRVVEYRKGGVVAVLPGATLRERVDAHEDWRVRYLAIDGPLARRFADRLRTQAGSDVIVFSHGTPDGGAALEHLDELFRLTIDQPAGWDWHAMSRLHAMLGRLLSQPTAETGATASGRPVSLGSRMMELVESRPQHPWRVSELAEALGVSESQLAHSFKANEGVSPARWVRGVRMRLAKQYLQQGWNVREVAERMGIAHASHLSRAFKQAMTKAPSQFGSSAARSLHEREQPRRAPP